MWKNIGTTSKLSRSMSEEHVKASFDARLWNRTAASDFMEDGTFDVQNIIIRSAAVEMFDSDAAD